MNFQRTDPMKEFVTVTCDAQLFGLPIASVYEVFVPGRITRVPLAAFEILGITNLRGRVVTIIDMQRCLGRRGCASQEMIAVGIDNGGDAFGLVVDAVGEVVALDTDSIEPLPVNLDESLRRVATGICRLETGLLVLLDTDRLLADASAEMAA